MRIGIIGGGLTGMALADRLAARGHSVDVFERESQPGGLATYQDFGRFFWDRFYHVILPSDTHLIRFVGDIGLGSELRWRQTRTGFYVDGRMHSISNSMEFLRFPLLSLIDKMRLAWTMIYSSRIDDWRRLEKVPVAEWLQRVSGKRTYEKMWRPLLLAKLGESYERVSAVFIWSYIKRLFSARDSSASKEQLGHVSGGYKRVFDTLDGRIRGAGGAVHTGVAVESIRARGSGGVDVAVVGAESSRHYDKVVCTSPVPALRRITDPALLKVEAEGGEVEYLGVVCVVLVTREPVVPFYVVNIADETIPFTGIIGMSNVVDTGETDGLHLTYLPKYVLSTDEWLTRDGDDIRREFLAGLEKMLPDFDPAMIEKAHVHRAVRVQPLQVLDYSRIVPQVTTRNRDFFVLNTAQFVNGTLNNNEVIRSVDEFMAEHGASFGLAGERDDD